MLINELVLANTDNLGLPATCQLTLIRTSPAFGGATSTVSMTSGFFASHATAA
jgi:hypothetical protein